MSIVYVVHANESHKLDGVVFSEATAAVDAVGEPGLPGLDWRDEPGPVWRETEHGHWWNGRRDSTEAWVMRTEVRE